MPIVQVKDADIFYKSYGGGAPLLLLHAGWGTPINGFEEQIAALSDRFRVIIPHRRGYGRSSRVHVLSPNYHREAVPDMLAVLDHAGVEAAHLWGHSDGAVVGAWMAILNPAQVRSLIFEGGHLWARKGDYTSHAFMQRVRERPETLPAEMQAALAAGHGADYWKRLLWLWTDAWRVLYDRAGDLYNGRLGEIRCPTLVMHGGKDPHTPLSEVENLAAQITNARTLFIQQGGHSLHDDPSMLDAVHAAVIELID
jgi:pimeloyl-ACP methyl ester carboxylesterase